MTGKLTNEIAIVAGASKGIGRSIATALAKEGANVVVNYISNAASAEEVVKGISSVEPSLLAPTSLPHPVARSSSRKQLASLAKSTSWSSMPVCWCRMGVWNKGGGFR